MKARVWLIISSFDLSFSSRCLIWLLSMASDFITRSSHIDLKNLNSLSNNFLMYSCKYSCKFWFWCTPLSHPWLSKSANSCFLLLIFSLIISVIVLSWRYSLVKSLELNFEWFHYVYLFVSATLMFLFKVCRDNENALIEYLDLRGCYCAVVKAVVVSLIIEWICMIAVALLPFILSNTNRNMFLWCCSGGNIYIPCLALGNHFCFCNCMIQ